MNLLLAFLTTARGDHLSFMSHLSPTSQANLREKISNLQRRGILADWGYAVPVVRTVASSFPTATPPTVLSSLRDDPSSPGSSPPTAPSPTLTDAIEKSPAQNEMPSVDNRVYV